MSKDSNPFAVMPWWSKPMQFVANALIIMVAGTAILVLGQVVLAPIFLSIVIGLMFGPLADRIERLGISPIISGGAVVLCFFLLILITLSAIIMPLSSWLSRLPELWSKLQQLMTDWEGVMSTVEGAREQLNKFTAQSADMVVQVEDDSPIESVAIFAPVFLAQVLIFLASLYFFIATRTQIKEAVVAFFSTKDARLSVAHIFEDVERFVSRYLLSITFINFCLGLTISLALWAAGVPAPFLWGMMAGIMNYITYIGPAIMLATLFGVGLVTFDSTNAAFIPVLIYLIINFVEAQFVTPMLIGRAMLLNPFLVFFSISYWIWAWGPIGGFVAVPSLLISSAIIGNIKELGPNPVVEKSSDGAA